MLFFNRTRISAILYMINNSYAHEISQTLAHVYNLRFDICSDSEECHQIGSPHRVDWWWSNAITCLSIKINNFDQNGRKLIDNKQRLEKLKWMLKCENPTEELIDGCWRGCR